MASLLQELLLEGKRWTNSAQSGASQDPEVIWNCNQENVIQGIGEAAVGGLKKPKGGTPVLQRWWPRGVAATVGSRGRQERVGSPEPQKLEVGWEEPGLRLCGVISEIQRSSWRWDTEVWWPKGRALTSCQGHPWGAPWAWPRKGLKRLESGTHACAWWKALAGAKLAETASKKREASPFPPPPSSCWIPPVPCLAESQQNPWLRETCGLQSPHSATYWDPWFFSISIFLIEASKVLGSHPRIFSRILTLVIVHFNKDRGGLRLRTFSRQSFRVGWHFVWAVFLPCAYLLVRGKCFRLFTY